MNFENSEVRPAVQEAARVGNVECTELLLKAGANVNAQHEDIADERTAALIEGTVKRTALIEAINSGSLRCVFQLIKEGADVNIMNRNTLSALHFAVKKGKRSCVKLFTEERADVNQRNHNGETPLHIAFRFKRHKTTHQLIESGADVNMVDNAGRTILMQAARRHYKLVKFLLAVGADVNAMTSDTYSDGELKTALHRAAGVRGIGRVQLLLKAGARINIRDCLGRNCLQISIAWERQEILIVRNIHMLLYAAGEILDGPTVIRRDPYDSAVMSEVEIPQYFKELKRKRDLKHLCREAIRKHLINLDPHEHLFGRIPQLGLPSVLTRYLMYGCSIDSDDETDGEESSQSDK